MGLPVEWFVQTPIDEEYMCPVCMEVMESPTMIESCEHIFCGVCIQECKAAIGQCPMDREPIGGLRPPHRTFVNAYNRLQVRCRHAEFGCVFHGNVTNIKEHHDSCEYANPDVVKPCAKDCGAEVKMRELSTHDCIAYLKTALASKSFECEVMTEEIAELYTQVLALESIKATRASKQDAMLDEVNRLEEALAKLKVEIVMQKDADTADRGGPSPGEPIVEFPEDGFEDLDLDAIAIHKTSPGYSETDQFFQKKEREAATSTAANAAKIRARRRLMKAAATSPSVATFFGSPQPSAPIAINSAAAATAPPALGLGGQPQPVQGLGGQSTMMPPPSGASGTAPGVNLGGIQISHWPWPWPYTNNTNP